MKHIPVIFLILALAAITGCNESTSPSKKPNAMDIPVNGGYSFISNIIDSSDNGNLSGLMILIKEKRNDIVTLPENGVPVDHDYDGYDKSVYASMSNSDYSSLPMNKIIFNGVPLFFYPEGYYYTGDYNGLYINSGLDWNKFQVEPKDNFPSVSDSVQLPEELNITNLKRNDTLHRSQDFVIKWTGSSQAKYYEISVKINDTKTATLTAKKNVGFSSLSPVSGSHKLDAIALNQACELNGRYDIKVTAFTPIYKRISNGRDILIMAVLSHNVTVNLTD